MNVKTTSPPASLLISARLFCVYLISHQRPIAELFHPHRKELPTIYESEFVRMAQIDVALEELGRIREELITKVNSLSIEEKQFLLCFKAIESN